MRSALLAATLSEVEAVGLDRASLRSIARRVGVSHQAIAYHFADRTALFTAVAAESWSEMRHAVSRGLHETGDELSSSPPGGEVVKVGRSYIRFARENPARFALMFASSVLDLSSPELCDAQARMWELHLGTIESAVKQGWGGDVPADQLALATFSLAHGLASLAGNLPALVSAGQPEDVLDIVNRAIIT